MSSAVVLLCVAGAWAIVLWPTLRRKADAASELRSVDRFRGAMTVLSRRPSSRGHVSRGHVSRGHVVPRAFVVPHRASAPVTVDGAAFVARPVLSVAQRRQRTVLLLAGLVFLSLVLVGFVGGVVLWTVQVLADVALGSVLAWLRHTAMIAAVKRQQAARVLARGVGRTAPVVAPRAAVVAAEVPLMTVPLAGVPAQRVSSAGPVPAAGAAAAAAAATLVPAEPTPVGRPAARVLGPRVEVAPVLAEPVLPEPIISEPRPGIRVFDSTVPRTPLLVDSSDAELDEMADEGLDWVLGRRRVG